MSQATLTMPQEAQDIVILKGGLDQVTPRLELGPGAARRMVNFECGINGGYARISGYERFDGRDSPSSKTYKLLPIVEFFSTPFVSATLTAISGAFGTIIAVGTDHVAVANVTGTFEQGDMVSTATGVVGVIGAQTVRLSKSLRKQYVNLAADVWRAFIGAVPGTGPVRGVFGAVLKGAFGVYAFRDNAAGDQCVMYKASRAGWTLVPFLCRVEFYEGGPVQLEEGGSIVYASIRMTVKRVLIQGGSWAANTASGWIVLDPVVTGSLNTNNSPYTIGGTTFKTRHGSGVIKQRPGGQYEFAMYNFSGRQQTQRIYGCDGVNNCFEFDGEIFASIPLGLESPIYTGNANGDIVAIEDKPSHIMPHQQALFVSIGSSVLFTGPGTPYDFTPLHGGGEVATGDVVTGFQVLPGSQSTGAMAVMGRNQTKVLYGTALAGPKPFDLVNFETQTGNIAGTIQTIDRVYYVDDRGVVNLEAVQSYGNFSASTVTRSIQPFMDLKRGRAVCSTVNRSKNQYRVFFLDGTGLFLTLDNGKLKGAATVAFPHQLTCAWSGEDQSGSEHTYVGSRDGYVYEMERGTSFDGEPIAAELLLNWNAMGSPRLRKTIHGSAVEFSEDSDHVEMRVAARMGPELTAHPTEDVAHTSVTEIDAQWDHFNWGNVWWDGKILSPMDLDVRGTAERVQFYFKSETDYLEPFTMTEIITRYFKRRGVRG